MISTDWFGVSARSKSKFVFFLYLYGNICLFLIINIIKRDLGGSTLSQQPTPRPHKLIKMFIIICYSSNANQNQNQKVNVLFKYQRLK